MGREPVLGGLLAGLAGCQHIRDQSSFCGCDLVNGAVDGETFKKIVRRYAAGGIVGLKQFGFFCAKATSLMDVSAKRRIGLTAQEAAACPLRYVSSKRRRSAAQRTSCRRRVQFRRPVRRYMSKAFCAAIMI
jgi:hypothetical protein